MNSHSSERGVSELHLKLSIFNPSHTSYPLIPSLQSPDSPPNPTSNSLTSGRACTQHDRTTAGANANMYMYVCIDTADPVACMHARTIAIAGSDEVRTMARSKQSAGIERTSEKRTEETKGCDVSTAPTSTSTPTPTPTTATATATRRHAHAHARPQRTRQPCAAYSHTRLGVERRARAEGRTKDEEGEGRMENEERKGRKGEGREGRGKKGTQGEGEGGKKGAQDRMYV